jgi:ABC-type uncharacterized transport system substrate-binding protein
VERRYLVGLLATVAAWPLVARAAAPNKNYRIGFVAQISRDAPQWNEVIDELARSGFVEGGNLVVDRRGLGAGLDQMNEIVAELISASPDLIYCGGDTALHAAARATKEIPILGTADDYLATGLVTSLARPGGNLTGVSLFAPELNGKRIELLIEMLPGIKHVAVLADRRVASAKNLQAIEEVIRPRGIDFSLQWVAHEHEIAPALKAAQTAGAQAISVLSSPLLHSVHVRILDLLDKDRMPAIFQWPDYATQGALAGYGPRILRVFRQVGQQMVKVLRGTKPADIPIEQPTTFELAINLKTAKALGLTIPPSILARADEVIE